MLGKEKLMEISEFYNFALAHQKEHKVDCGAMPYAYGNALIKLVAEKKPAKMLEVGTGIGFSTVCLALGNPQGQIHTIDKNSAHIEIAENFFKEFGVEEQITIHMGTAEDILPTLNIQFDLIFYDGFIPQKKFVFQFYNMLSKGGMLVSTNLFLAEKSGGKYLKMLSDPAIWQTKLVGDTAFSIKK